MRRIHLIKLCVVALFAALGAFALITDSPASRRAYARSTGPDPGFTGAPGEFKCDECHVFDGAPSGTINVGAPQSYVPGQTYAITVNEANASPTRQRWGFQLTAVDDNGNRAGTLRAGADGRTQVIAGLLGNPARQYVEHTQAGTSVGQTNGASWTFNWTAPAADVGPVTFYTAGNQANNDGNTSGDSINFTFVVVQPSAGAGDFTITVSPSSQVIVPGASGTYTVTVTPTNGFTGPVNLSVAGLPTGASAVFNPTLIDINGAGAKTSALTVTNNSSTPLGSFNFTVNGGSVFIARTGGASLVTGPTMTDANLTVRQVVAGLSQPTTLAFLGDNDFLILEKASGRVLRVTNGVAQTTPVVDLAVNNNSERGLLGVALHPNFPTNPRVYLYWTESATGADSANADEVPLLGNRVDSFLWNGSTLTLEKNLIHLRALQQDAGQSSRGNHNGGIIRFGPDGKLYVVIGDNGRRGMLQNLRFGPSASPGGPTVVDDQFGGPEPDNAHLTGVILRLNDDGTAPTDNPFFNVNSGLAGEAAANVKKVFGYGVRNSFGMAFDPASGYLWTQENGDDSFDEINRVVPGFNGGWIQLMGPSSRVGEYKQIETSRAGGLQQIRWMPDRIADTPAQALSRLFVLPGSRYTEPAFSWRYAVAPSPVGFVRGRGLGPTFENDLLVGASRTTLAGGYLFRFKLSDDRADLKLVTPQLADRVADNNDKFDLTESETLLVGRDFGITTDIQTTPSGNVYVVSLSNGAIYEISAKPNTVQFASANFQASEGDAGGAPRATITVTRTGDTSGTISVDYQTIESLVFVPCDPNARDANNQPPPRGVASARCDYATTIGTLTFGPNETSKTFTVPVIDDSYVEGNETFTATLSNPAGATLGSTSFTTVTITDNDVAGEANPIDGSAFFIRQQYLDFLVREPDAAGLQFYLGILAGCQPSDVECNKYTRGALSANFFRSPEFQQKGSFVMYLYMVSLGQRPATVSELSDPAKVDRPHYSEFISDLQAISDPADDKAIVSQKKDALTVAWLQRGEVQARLPSTLTNAQFVQKLVETAGVTLANQSQLVADLNANVKTRAQVLRLIVESAEVDQKFYKPAFVTMEYFGYLRRDPEVCVGSPSPSQCGYLFHNNRFLLSADPDFLENTIVRGFIESPEYRSRFGNN
jgi:glucose/arabinose dehydrogenase